MFFELKAVLQFLFDLAVVFWFFRPVTTQVRPARRAAAAQAVLLLTFPLYFVSGLTFIVRILIRFAVYFAALTVSGVRSLLRNVYLSVLVSILFMACQNIFFSPKLVDIYRGTYRFTGVRSVDLAACIVIQWVVYILVFFYIRKMIKLDKLQRFEPVEWMVAAVALITEVYIKQALPTVSSTEGEHVEITIFSVILNIVVVAFLGSFERYIHEKKRSEEMRLQEVMNEAYFKNLELKKQRDEDVRRLHHDMKNHLLAIEKMAGSGDCRVTEYIGELAGALEPYESLVETGNELLNGILSEKQALARTKEIDLEIQADCSGLKAVSDMDLCTIFGNALDNAIEACEKVEPAEERVIRVRTESLAGQTFITFMNSCTGTVTMENGLPQTTKKDKNMHGIGIRSIRRALEKYGGTLRMKSEPDRFTLTVMIPMSGQATNTGDHLS